MRVRAKRCPRSVRRAVLRVPQRVFRLQRVAAENYRVSGRRRAILEHRGQRRISAQFLRRKITNELRQWKWGGPARVESGTPASITRSTITIDQIDTHSA